MINIIKQTITSKPRRLSATWTFEAAQEFESENDFDIEMEIYRALMWEDRKTTTQDKLCEYGSVFISKQRKNNG